MINSHNCTEQLLESDCTFPIHPINGWVVVGAEKCVDFLWDFLTCVSVKAVKPAKLLLLAVILLPIGFLAHIDVARNRKYYHYKA